MQSYPPTYAPYPMPQPSLPQLSQPMPPLPLPPPFQPSQLPAQPLPNPNNKVVQMIHSMNPLSSFRYQNMPVGVSDLQLRSGEVVTSENQKKPMVIIDEKGEEETPKHSKKDDTIQPTPIHFEPLSSSSNQPPYLGRLVVEKKDPIPKSSLASKLRNLFIRVPLLQSIK